MSNKQFIEGIRHVPIGMMAKYEAGNLYKLLKEAAEELESAKRTKQWIESAISLKYEEKVRAKRQRFAKDTGIIHLEDDGFKVTNDVPKKVNWNQEKLAKIAAEIVLNGGKLDDYVETYYKVHEVKYNSWSETLRNLFEPARTVALGKSTYKLTNLNLNSEVDYE